jgi:hypothetical protein
MQIEKRFTDNWLQPTGPYLMIIPYLILAGKPEILLSFLLIQLLQNGDLSAAKDQRHHSFINPCVKHAVLAWAYSLDIFDVSSTTRLPQTIPLRCLVSS